MTDIDVEDFATELANEVMPVEAIFAIDTVRAYIAGGRSRKQLFSKNRAQPSSFSHDIVTNLFPYVLFVASTYGRQLLDILTPHTTESILGILHHVLGIKSEIHHSNDPKNELMKSQTDQVVKLIEDMSKYLKKNGVDDSNKVAIGIVKVIASDPSRAITFIDALNQKTK